MAVSYKKLWKLLIDRDLKKKDLINMAGISNYTLARLNKGENISTETIAKICKALDCSFDDITKMPKDILDAFADAIINEIEKMMAENEKRTKDC